MEWSWKLLRLERKLSLWDALDFCGHGHALFILVHRRSSMCRKSSSSVLRLIFFSNFDHHINSLRTCRYFKANKYEYRPKYRLIRPKICLFTPTRARQTTDLHHFSKCWWLFIRKFVGTQIKSNRYDIFYVILLNYNFKGPNQRSFHEFDLFLVINSIIKWVLYLCEFHIWFNCLELIYSQVDFLNFMSSK